MKKLIQALIPHLPRYAEEEGDFYSVKRDDLVNKLCGQEAIEQSTAKNAVDLCELLLDTLATLNADYLQKGEWCFVSFPAQLIATSVLTALSDGESHLFAPNFWNTQGISNDKKNQQRDVLSLIENARYENHASQQAQPIRYCYVAWSIIKLDGKILFYQREDTQKRFDKSAGDYGLIGGRANQNDVPITDKASLLKALQSPNSELIKKALPETLKRELREEAGLLFETHYTFKPWRSLKPYRQVQGAAPNHALTEYYLDIFLIDLSLEGYLFLRQKPNTDERLAWISITDIERGKTSDNKIPYIKALYDDFDGDRSALAAELKALPDSFVAGYLFRPNKYGITLPIDPAKPVLAGTLGKDKPLNLHLTARRSALVLGLAAHLRGFEFASLTENIVLHPFGWIEVSGQAAIQAELTALAALLNGGDLVMENHRDTFFRLSIAPEVIFFADELFSFSVQLADLNATKTKIPVTLERHAFETALGCISQKTEEFQLTLEFVHKLRILSAQSFSTDNDEALKTEDNYKKGLHKEAKFQALGLRNLVRQEEGVFRFVLPYVCN
ncbi:MAG: NUDIX hydrolase [Methylobacter sp.]|uniref:NUDIX hydrolase n=1 Tax=Methylobacter sp. TaxID=2051955 RepID=UPI00258C0D77|nr:NUDIX hydrolase [Methylobacter sp.]MCL7421839.1 NUDIX hydrolase [Methylobacter sp.]